MLRESGNANGMRSNLNLRTKQKEIQAASENINIREALFGGRTEGFKTHVKMMKTK